MTSGRFGIGALLFSVLSLAACSASPDTTASNESMDTSGTAKTLGVVKGREYAKCWFDVVGDQAQLSCTTTARGDDPIGAQVRVVVTGSTPINATLDIEAGGTVVAGSIPVSSFPRTVEIQSYLTTDARSMLGTDEGSISSGINVATPDALASASPLVLKQPYDLWALGTVFAIEHGGGYSFSAHEYTQSLGDYSAGLAGKKELKLTPNVGHFDKKIFWIVAPTTPGPLPVTISHDGTKFETSIAGPGYWAITDTSIRAATPGEIAQTFAEATTTTEPPSTTTTEPPATTTTEPPTTTTPPAPVDADPTCGGDKQTYCAGYSCDDRTRWDGTVQSCVACGAAGQTYCFPEPKHFTSSGGYSCNAGTRWDGTTATCTPCGGAGQTYCFIEPNHFSANGGYSCNAGTRWDGTTAKCVSCGTDGETYCVKDPNNFSSSSGLTCNDGLTYNSSTGRCQH